MNNRRPIVTLSVVVGLAMMLFGVNMANTGDTVSPPGSQPGSQPGPAGGATATASPSAPATPTATPTPAAAALEAAYAGRTSGNEAAIAIAVKAGKAVAYVCDGRRVEAWLTGTLSGSKLTLKGKRGALLSGTVDGGAVFGTVRLAGTSWPYSAQVAKRPAGLYRADAAVRGVRNRIGWIVLQDGRQVGIRDEAGSASPAPNLDPDAGTVTVDGANLPVQSIAGDESFAS
jgi:hypothetical protein